MCSGKLFVIGSRKRKVIEPDETVRILIIRRLRCEDCGKIHHELPDILVPYKRHCYETIEKIINNEIEEGNCCEESTIRRIKAWWVAILPYFINILSLLSEKYKITFGAQLAPKEIIRAVVNANFWVHTRSAFLSG